MNEQNEMSKHECIAAIAMSMIRRNRTHKLTMLAKARKSKINQFKKS